MAGEALAVTQCNACGNDGAMIKKISNSPLLYLHCKTCGCDRRSGPKIQAEWAAIVRGEGSPVAATISENKADPQEWEPEKELTELAEVEPNEKTKGGAKAVFSVGLMALGFVGLLLKAAR